MTSTRTILPLLIVFILTAAAVAATPSPTSSPATGPTASSAPAGEAASAPAAAAGASTAPAAATGPAASRPAGAGVTLATVGDTAVTSGLIDKVLSQAPPGYPAERLQQVRKKMQDELILQALLHEYIKAQKMKCSADELAKEKAQIAQVAKASQMTVDEYMAAQGVTDEMLCDRIVYMRMLDDATSKEKVDAFIKNHPDYFNGTTISASHILILATPSDSTDKQKADREKLQKVAEEIKSGKMSFEDAAKKYSQEPRADQSAGKLPDFTFGEMVPSFSEMAFATKPGEVSPIVRTVYGFHIINVTKRTEGHEPMDASKAAELAKQSLQSDVATTVISFGISGAPIVLKEQPASQPTSAAASQPASKPAEAPTTQP